MDFLSLERGSLITPREMVRASVSGKRVTEEALALDDMAIVTFSRRDLLTLVGETGARRVKAWSGRNDRLYRGVVAGGGDGTLFEVINGYYQNPAQNKIPLGVLPVGTGNAFARDLGLDASRWEEAVDIIASGKLKQVDAGFFKTHGQDYYFLNILGLGFVADVGKTARRLKIFGKFLIIYIRIN